MKGTSWLKTITIYHFSQALSKLFTVFYSCVEFLYEIYFVLDLCIFIVSQDFIKMQDANESNNNAEVIIPLFSDPFLCPVPVTLPTETVLKVLLLPYLSLLCLLHFSFLIRLPSMKFESFVS